MHYTFPLIIWFSARDIDLLPYGVKPVRPQVLTLQNMADEYYRLVGADLTSHSASDRLTYFQNDLTDSSIGPVLFVFDNFETADKPHELYEWLDTYVRLPNKILVTTRYRDFKGDYYIEVSGMEDKECEFLIDSTARNLDIGHLLTASYREELIRESEGHPYVIKILLGEVARSGQLRAVERIPATKEQILDALFDRTYARLSPAAQRVFLTLSRWRSVVPEVALGAVLQRPANEKMDVYAAVDELRKSSFVEVLSSPKDEEPFLSVPLAASAFGRRKLQVSPMKSAIEADVTYLMEFGPAKRFDVGHGLEPRIYRLFSSVADGLREQLGELEERLPILEYICRRYPKAWLHLASLYEELEIENYMAKSRSAIENYLERAPKGIEASDAWQRLARMSQKMGDKLGEVQALLELCELPETPFSEISNNVNRLNSLFARKELVLDSDAKSYIVRRFIDLMEKGIEEGDATDCSRLAWLCIHLQDKLRAQKYTVLGLSIEPYNQYCLNLKETVENWE